MYMWIANYLESQISSAVVWNPNQKQIAMVVGVSYHRHLFWNKQFLEYNLEDYSRQ